MNSWEFWWESNKDGLLPRSSARDISAVTGSDSPTAAHGSDESRSRRDSNLAEQIMPAIEHVLSTEHEPDLVDSAVLALARVTPADLASGVCDDICRGLRHDALSVRTSSALSLGVLGAPRALPLLNALMADTASGRKASGSGAVPWQVRSHAAIALGLLNDPLAIDPLLDVIARSPVAQRELRTAAVVGLGLMHNERSEDAVKGLVALLESREPDPMVLATVPTALAKLDDVSVVPRLLALYRSPQTDQTVKQSLAIALGRLGDLGQDTVIESLTDTVANDADAPTRHFANIALARIGACGRDHGDPGRVEQRRQLDRFLRQQVTEPTHRTDRSWSVLALAVYAQGQPAARPAMSEVLKTGYGHEHDPSGRAAFALALGLVGAQDMAPRLLDDFRASHDDAFRGYAAISLGLLHDLDAADVLIPLCSDKSVSDTLRQQVVRGLSLMDDPELTTVLIDALAEARTLPMAWSLGRALGQRRDVRSIEPLVHVLDDDTRAVPARAFACVALGLIGDRLPLRFNSDIAQDCNYLVRTATLDDVLSL